MCDGFDFALFLAKLIGNIFHPTSNLQPLTILGIIDSQSLYEALGTSKQIQDKRLHVEISALLQMVEKDEVTVSWKPGAR